jgi:potassium channel subfamily K
MQFGISETIHVGSVQAKNGFQFIFSWKNKETWITLSLVAFYYAAAVAFYMPMENLKMGEAIYFATVMITTVGYGDILPTSIASKIFTMVLVHFGLIIVGFSLTNVQQYILQKTVKMAVDVDSLALADAQANKKKASRKRFVISFCLYLAVIGLGTLCFGWMDLGLEGEDARWRWTNGAYLAVITMTTIGFGDYSPTDFWGRSFACVLMFVGIPTFIYSTANLAEFIFGEQRAEEVRLKRVVRLNPNKFSEISEFCTKLSEAGARNNADDSKISRLEYLCYCIVQNDLTSIPQIKEIMENFNELDCSGTGYIDPEDAGCIDVKSGNTTPAGSPGEKSKAVDTDLGEASKVSL